MSKNPKGISGIDWPLLERQFEDIKIMLPEFQLCSDEEWEMYQLHILTYGQIKSSVGKKYDWGLYVSDIGEDRREKLKELACELGFLKRDNLPSHLSYLSVPPQEIIEKCIQQKTADTALIQAWGRYHQAAGKYFALISGDGEAEKQLDAKIEGMRATDVRINKYWYARWVYKHTPDLNKHKRIDCNEELGQFCYEIAREEVYSPKPYPSNWFRRMLVGESKRNVKASDKCLRPELKETYADMSKKELIRFAIDMRVPDSVLPPFPFK